MNRVKVATDYSIDFLEVDRPQPLSDKLIEETIQEVEIEEPVKVQEQTSKKVNSKKAGEKNA